MITAYIIKDPKGVLLPNSVRLLRKDCVNDFTGNYHFDEWYKNGWRCVKILITQVK